MNDLKIISGKETSALLGDAAAAHRKVIAISPNPEEHRAVANLIERMMEAGAWARK